MFGLGEGADAMAERSARLAQNEAVFRAGNAAINGNLNDADVNELPYLCECGVDTCFERVALARGDYELVRSHPARFFVAPGHEDLTAGEVVILRTKTYTVVEKTGVERKIVQDAADPDAPHLP
jgi:hypothetical protein